MTGSFETGQQRRRPNDLRLLPLALRRGLAIVSLLCAANAASAQSFAEGRAAYGLYDVPKAEEIYRAVQASPQASLLDRSAASRELARIAWLVDGRRGDALALLGASLGSDPDPCPAAHLFARIVNDGQATAAQLEQVASLATACLEIEPGVALEAIRATEIQAAAVIGTRRKRVELARQGLRDLAALPPGTTHSMQGARLRLALGLLAEDPVEAEAGWRSYFWLSGNAGSPPALKLNSSEVRQIFDEGLARGARSSVALRLAGLLQRAGFGEELRRYARLHRPAAGAGLLEWNAIDVDLMLRGELGQAILAHDRAFARTGAEDAGRYEAALADILNKAARKLDPNSQDVRSTLRERLGLWGTEPGKSNGVTGIHLGYVVVDDGLEIEQDQRRGSIRLLVLDNMIHNSFSAWLMDGASAPGGWAVDGKTIVQIRPRYLMLIDGYARLASPGAARTRALDEIERLRLSDRKLALVEEVAFFPGVRERLRMQAIDAIVASIRASGEADFQLAFRKAYSDALIGSGIRAHEGRHVLDQATYSGPCELPNPELEFRAKLSEIRFAPQPRLALSSIYSPLFGGQSGHGIANKRLMSHYHEWIRDHPSAISSFDPGLSPLEQLDKLSDVQIVAVAEALERGLEGCR